jgi:transcriptional regulator NrdR family protein
VNCPTCNGKSEVESTRSVTRRTKRVRKCSGCGHRFATVETLLAPLVKAAPKPAKVPAASGDANLWGVWR